MSPDITLGTTQGTWGLVFSCPGASRHQAPICEASSPLCKPSSATESLSWSVPHAQPGLPQGPEDSPPALRVQVKLAARRGCETPSGTWAGNSSTESDTEDPGQGKWTQPNSAEGTEKSPCRGRSRWVSSGPLPSSPSVLTVVRLPSSPSSQPTICHPARPSSWLPRGLRWGG